MDKLKSDFELNVKHVNNLTTQPSNDILLSLYGFYKQATIGNINTSRPGMFDLKGKAKWDAWNANKGMSTEVAMQQYISIVKVNKL